MKNILIASLGESPPVVTETIDKLKAEENVKLHIVVTVSTTGPDAKESERILADEISSHYCHEIQYIPDYVQANDIDTQEDNIAFLERVSTWFKTYSNDNIYVSIAGGRKTMSAIMTLAAQIYGARMLCHVTTIDPDLEARGKIDVLKLLPADERKSVFHPPSDDVALVRLPFISLFPMLPQFINALSGKTERTTQMRVSASDILQRNGLLEKHEGAFAPTELGKRLLQVLKDVEALPEPSPLRPDEKKITVSDHSYGGKRRYVEEFAKKIARCPFVVSVQTIPYGSTTIPSIRKVNDDGTIEIDYPTREWSAGLLAVTTAKSKAQAQAVAKELERTYL